MVPYWKIFGRLGNNMFQGAYLYAQVRRGAIQDIYVQNEEYFAEFKDEIRELYSQNIRSFPYVSIHVRRKDYVDNKFYVDIFANGYYERAMALFPKKEFVVFSDDIEWCRQQPIFKDCLFSEGYDEIEDMNRMAGCEFGHIIANSSFSWWAAWLDPKQSKVVAPKEWYTLSSPNDNEELIASTRLPKEWLKI